ncbi:MULTISPECIES: 5,10-methylenetetrahydrofolate reductase [Rhizobium/Agrobacterium group]|uniref:5,10-methylenetetrahydrofolate reductase n=1 Tax=Rhizobium/Agrobacterium group TaxID=227290 RepID=UPI000B406BBA|nr:MULTISPECIES: 5,10-methylenetetrahydrofolate reductase [Rhizobium/Agrobacterium group]MCF1481396.1 methylenetetrahydrofolate reductase [Allorhizobium ampelinum]NSZ45247.1 methylenetetrahydrofolate reductase [Agrobacterium vitis]NTA28994.1 methylenetetrahydrofolate reductase [Allorhizobium ampelinum]OVE90934.1 5,10-methylenetetrahydrofolate reductase [Allorhizobium ampelinum]
MMDKAVLTDSQEYTADQGSLLDAWSIEVTPRTAAKIASFQALLPAGTRIYIAHVDGTPFEDMVATARRLHQEGFPVMPHIPARSLADVTQLEDLLKQYRDEADVRQALLLAGGIAKPRGTLSSSMQLIETGLFDRLGFTHLHIAGHPEGNRDIDADGSTTQIDAALRWKFDFSSRTDAQMAIVTQFAFDAKVIIDWAERIDALGIGLPIHVGIAGPAKLQTLIKYAISCGVGPSLKVLQKRALDLRKLLMPYEPTDMVGQLIAYKAENPQSNISKLHLFPLGGIEPAARWIDQYKP